LPVSNSKDKPLIYIGAPCFDKVDPELLEDWMRFAFHLGRRMPQYNFMTGIKTKSEQFRARNEIVDAAKTYGATYLLMLDDDMIINTFVTEGKEGEGDDSYSFLEKMIAHDKDICGALYWQRGGDCKPVMMYKVTDTGYRFLRDDELEWKLQKVDVAGGGCLLIKMSVFDKIPPPYFAPEFKWGTDVQICRRAAEAGFEVWADTSIELGHLRSKKEIITKRNRKRISLEECTPGEISRSFVTNDIYARLMNDASEFTGIPEESVEWKNGGRFMEMRESGPKDDADWYRTFPMERVARQVWYNSDSPDKRYMTEYIIKNFSNSAKGAEVLVFGCGVGIEAFALAEYGHKVTALDIRGTGPLEFLKWRCKRNAVEMQFIESEGGPPVLTQQYDAIIAMDCIEHIEDWRGTVAALAAALKVNGVLFSNNAILDDKSHAEHYDIDRHEFVKVCMANGLDVFNQITYTKQPVKAEKEAKELVHA
jgi:2-polyprenyl-3-methyl-5-hydroxy-6-metoxy-1,4-benzoquinol methylase